MVRAPSYNPPVDANQRLDVLREKLMEEYTGVQTWFFLYGLILFLVLGAVLLVVMTALYGSDAEPGGLTLGLMLLGAVTLVVVILIATERCWQRQYRLVWRYLQYTSLAALVIDETVWDEVLAQARGNIALKASGLDRPRTLEELLELAADYWRYILAVAGGRDAATRQRMLGWDNGTRVYNNIVNSLCNGCLAYILLVALSTLLVVLFPLMYMALHFYIKQHAAKSALIDYFVDRPRISRKKLEPL